ncbi:MAG: NAD-dependent epimerase/dehydratase family protein [Planctomycetota bacterium]|nr:MAG: NAD-dependent epimerase/dehydratase family protein [Planctomycetota bacterium]
MEALVTGGTGFIGSHIVRALRGEGWAVRCLVRSSSPREQLADLEVRFVDGDVRDLASLREASRGCDAVFHAAAYYALWSRDDEAFTSINVEGTRKVLEAARSEGVRRVVYTSSVSCIGEAPPGGLADEDTPCTPEDLCGAYKRTKYEAERVALAAAADGQEVVVVNPASVIGPGDVKPTPTGKIIVDFMEGRMPFYLDTGLNFVDVRDVAQGHLLAYERGRSGRRYILGNREGNKSLREFLAVLGEVCGRRPPRFKIPYGVAWMAGAVSTFVADTITHRPPGVPLNGVRMARHRMFFDPSRAVRELGLPQTPLRTTLEDAVAWFREHAAAAGR